MGKALEIITGYATAPGATLTALTMATGDSTTVRNFTDGKTRIVTAWPTGKTTLGSFVIKSPRMHDNVRGITVPNPVSPIKPQLWLLKQQELLAQDQLTLQISGSAGAGEFMLASLLNYYDNLPGIESRLITPEQLKSLGVDIMTVINTLTPTAGGTYEGAVAINATNDLMKANTDYALVGYELTVAAHAVSWKGSDTGNLRVGAPARLSDNDNSRNWFIELSNLTGLPCIPIFNSANKSNTFVEVVSDEVAAATTLTSIFVELAGSAS